MNQLEAISNCNIGVRRTVRYKDADEYCKSLSFMTYSCISSIDQIMRDCGFSIVKFGNKVQNESDEGSAICGVLLFGHSVYFIKNGFREFHTIYGDMSHDLAEYIDGLVTAGDSQSLVQLSETTVKKLGYDLMCKAHREFILTLQVYSEYGINSDVEIRN